MNSSSTTRRRFRKRLNRFFNSSRKVKVSVNQTLGEIGIRLPDSVIFGGMLRDLALAGSAGFSSDIDIVTTAPVGELELSISRFSPQKNRFGGYRFVAEGCSFDIWRLEDTWAVRKGMVVTSDFEGLLRTTFFNLDAIAYHLTKKKILVQPEYFTMLESKVLDINLEANPNPAGMAARALRVVQFKDVSLSQRLCEYILQHADISGLGEGSRSALRLLHDFFSSGRKGVFRLAPQTPINLNC